MLNKTDFTYDKVRKLDKFDRYQIVDIGSEKYVLFKRQVDSPTIKIEKKSNSVGKPIDRNNTTISVKLPETDNYWYSYTTGLIVVDGKGTRYVVDIDYKLGNVGVDPWSYFIECYYDALKSGNTLSKYKAKQVASEKFFRKFNKLETEVEISKTNAKPEDVIFDVLDWASSSKSPNFENLVKFFSNADGFDKAIKRAEQSASTRAMTSKIAADHPEWFD